MPSGFTVKPPKTTPPSSVWCSDASSSLSVFTASRSNVSPPTRGTGAFSTHTHTHTHFYLHFSFAVQSSRAHMDFDLSILDAEEGEHRCGENEQNTNNQDPAGGETTPRGAVAEVTRLRLTLTVTLLFSGGGDGGDGGDRRTLDFGEPLAGRALPTLARLPPPPCLRILRFSSSPSSPISSSSPSSSSCWTSSSTMSHSSSFGTPAAAPCDTSSEGLEGKSVAFSREAPVKAKTREGRKKEASRGLRHVKIRRKCFRNSRPWKGERGETCACRCREAAL